MFRLQFVNSLLDFLFYFLKNFFIIFIFLSGRWDEDESLIAAP